MAAAQGINDDRYPRKWLGCIVLLAIHLLLLINLAQSWSPTPDEPAHLAGGLMIWQYGRFDLYCVNPPLARSLAAVPAFVIGTEKGWANPQYQVQERPEFSAGTELVASHPRHWKQFLILGRLMLIPFSLAGALVGFLWAEQLYGTSAGFVALSLWCFSPNLLACGAIIGSDAAATSLGLAAGYAFWRWLKSPVWTNALMAGGLLGLAQLSKMTWIILFPLWMLLWLGSLVCRQAGGASARKQLGQLVAAMSLAVYLLCLGYGFGGMFVPLKDVAFHSAALAGPAAHADGAASGGNRFSQILLGRVPLPIPQDYVRGIDLQKADFENGKPSYLLGQWSNRGWYYYYLVGLAIKVPIGVIGLIVLVLATRGCSRDRSHSSRLSARTSPPPEAHQVRTGELVLLAHAFAVVVFVSLQNGFSCHFRYVVPAFPFVFVWVSQVGSRISRQSPLQSRLVLGCIVASVCSSLANYPHSMSYFNGIAGGPLHGHQYMLDSSHSWKQDIFYLKHWLDAHLPGELPFVSVAARIPADDFGIRHRGPSPAYRGNAASHHPEQEGPVPGWHAIDLQWIWDRKQEHRYFLTFEPVAKVGYSIYVYHLTLEDANRARRSLGLSELEAPKISVERFADRMRERVHRQMVPRVAVYTQPAVDGSLSEIPPELIACLPDGDLKSVDAAAIAAGELAHFDVVIVGGGKAHEQAAELGPSGLLKLREFVHNGGGYVGICAGAFLGSSTFEWSLGLVNVESNTGTHYVPRFGYQMWLDRGFGDVEAVLSDQGRQLFANEQSPFPLRFSGGPILRPGRQTHLGQFVSLADYSTEVSRFEFQQGTMRGTPAIVAAPYGDGTAVLLSSHAEVLPAHRRLVTLSIKVAAR